VGRITSGGGMLQSYKGIWPKLGQDVFIAPGAQIIGDVEIGSGSSIWFNCVLRGDVNKIRIGRNTNIQDGSVVHVESGGAATIIGDDVLIGHMALVHGTVLEDQAFVGMGAVTMDGCCIEGQGMLAAGALLTPGKRIKTAELWAGRPAKLIRTLRPEELAGLAKGTSHYAQMAQTYLTEYSDR